MQAQAPPYPTHPAMGLAEFVTESIRYFQKRVSEVEWMYRKVLELMILHAELETRDDTYADCHTGELKASVTRRMQEYYKREFSSTQHGDVWKELSDLYRSFPISDKGIISVDVPYTVEVDSRTSMSGIGISLVTLARDYELKMREVIYHGTRLFDHLSGLMIAQYLLAVEGHKASDITDKTFVRQLLSEIFRFKGHLPSNYDYRAIRDRLRDGCLSFYLEGCSNR